MSNQKPAYIKTLRAPNQRVMSKSVVYVMSRDQRVTDNLALLEAQQEALEHSLPLAVVFVLSAPKGHRSREQYDWMLRGLNQLESKLSALNIPLIMLIGSPRQVLGGFMSHTKPRSIYLDFSPLRGPRAIVDWLVETQNCGVHVVDNHNIVPLWQASDKQEVAARTIRTRIHRQIGSFLNEPSLLQTHPHTWPGRVLSINQLASQISAVLDSLPSNSVNLLMESGEDSAQVQLSRFIKDDLINYSDNRNDPARDAGSNLSPYLHFGQISALRVCLELRQVLISNQKDLHIIHSPKMPQAGDDKLSSSVDALVEELVVRKELSDNFCFYATDYRSLQSIPAWALESLAKHQSDPREFIYSLNELETAQTHDPAWNASQLQLRANSKMHGYMRMYWAKKVLEWSENASQALERLIYLNDFYSIDGGDPNGYVGILWSIGGLHDRPWNERSIFGKVRYMNYRGLKRKFDVESYQHQWLALTKEVLVK